MAEEKEKSNKVKVQITDGNGWIFDKFYPKGSIVELDQAVYESMKNIVEHKLK